MGVVTLSTVVNRTARGNRRERVIEVAFSSSYATNGDTFDAAGLSELSNVDEVLPIWVRTASGATHSDERLVWDGVNGKAKILSAAGVEVTAATDRSATRARLRIVGQ